MDVGVGGTRPPPPPAAVLPLRRRDGVGVASEEANRDRCGGGVPDGVKDRRTRLRPGEELVLPIGLDWESSGEEGPEKREIGF